VEESSGGGGDGNVTLACLQNLRALGLLCMYYPGLIDPKITKKEKLDANNITC